MMFLQSYLKKKHHLTSHQLFCSLIYQYACRPLQIICICKCLSSDQKNYKTLIQNCGGLSIGQYREGTRMKERNM